MSQLNYGLIRIGLLATLIAWATPTSPLCADEAKTARDVLAASGVSAGLCVHIDAGGEALAGLTAERAANSSNRKSKQIRPLNQAAQRVELCPAGCRLPSTQRGSGRIEIPFCQHLPAD